jgi:hypothetical protein
VTGTVEAVELRERARQARRAELLIADTDLGRVVRLAGLDTWRGPTAAEVGERLRRMAIVASACGDELASLARTSNAEADALERSALLPTA